MVEGRQRADALEFLRADADRRQTRLVVEMRNGVVGHGVP